MERYCSPARRIRYPHSENRKEEAYVVDVEVVDRVLIAQKDYVLELYNDMANTELHLTVRHKLREAAFALLMVFRPTWELFEYEYKYHELHKMFDEYIIV